MIVLVLNAGSSSEKSCLYNLSEFSIDTPAKPLWKADIDWSIDSSGGVLTVSGNDRQKKVKLERDNSLKVLLDTLIEGETKVLDSLDRIDVVGHRVVHGGTNSQPRIIDGDVKQAIADLIPLAPSHNPANLDGIETIEKILPNIPQVAVFDTAFHSTISEPAKVYPLPYKYYDRGIQRYGFHGISHEYCAHRTAHILQQPLDLKIINCHLGNGCSIAAIKDGVCIDTTMGFSPLEGLMMGSRSGSIDPQIIVYMMQEYGMGIEKIDRLLNKDSGLKGVSGISNDMRTVIEEIDKGNDRAQLALDIYIHSLVKAIGSMVASLNGLDVLVFTAGVGENNGIVREKACAGLQYLGLELDTAKNNAAPKDENIATKNSQFPVLVMHTEEEWAIACSASTAVNS